jgi:hypothetical protein
MFADGYVAEHIFKILGLVVIIGGRLKPHESIARSEAIIFQKKGKD